MSTSHPSGAPEPMLLEPWRGRLRRARKAHECAGYSEQDEYGRTYYSSGRHIIQAGELYVHAREVFAAGVDCTGEAYPMGAIDMRLCSDCASSRGHISYELESQIQTRNQHLPDPDAIAP